MKSKIFQKEQEFEEQRRLFSTKVQEMENIFQDKKNELLLKNTTVGIKKSQKLEKLS